MTKNVFGEALIPCSTEPMTGFYRNGCCDTGPEDSGTHSVCAIMTDEFLIYSKSKGNDLITPRPEFLFPGLKPGDRWCLCAHRWLESYRSECAPPVYLEATNEASLAIIPLEVLVSKAFKK